jgi:nitrite reductase/ring-hydroxylating ferredoxin subunit
VQSRAKPCKAVHFNVARQPHAPASVGATTFDGETVTCRRHFMRFDVRTGVCPDAPSRSTQTYPIRIQDGVVEVRL